MYVKIFISSLVWLVLCISRGNTVDQNDRVALFNHLVTQPTWQTFQSVEIIDQDTTLDINNILTKNGEITDQVADKKMRQLSLILSCEYSRKLRGFIILAQAIIKECSTKRNNDTSDFTVDCTRTVLKSVIDAGSMLSYMINSLTWFHRISPNFVEYNSLYGALMTFKLFTEQQNSENSTFLTGEVGINLENINDKLGMLSMALYNIDNKVQNFTIRSCRSSNYFIRINNITNVLNNHRAITRTRHIPSKLGGIMTRLMKEFTSDFNKSLGINNDAESCTTTTVVDINMIWQALQSQQPTGQPVKMLWFNNTTEITQAVAEVQSQDRTSKLVALQRSTLQAATDMLYTKTLNTVEYSLEIEIDDRLCPDNFLNTLKKYWSNLTRVDLIKIKYACPSKSEMNDELCCQTSFLNKLKSKWLNFTQINVSAIKAACLSVISANSGGELVKKLMNPFTNLRSSESKMSSEFTDVSKSNNDIRRQKEDFWTNLLKILRKTNVLKFPVELRTTLEVLDTFITEAMQNDRLGEAEKDVIGLLEIGLKYVSIDIIDETPAVSVDSSLKSLNKFIEGIVDVQTSIAVVNESNELLRISSDVEQNELLNGATDIDDKVVNSMCVITTKIISFFTNHEVHLRLCVSVLAKIQCYNQVQIILLAWKREFPNILRYVSELIESSPQIEIVSIQNALLLMSLHLNDAMKEERLKTFYEKSNPHNISIEFRAFLKLILLILNQLEKYVINNCSTSFFSTKVLNFTMPSLPNACTTVENNNIKSISKLVSKTYTSISVETNDSSNLSIEEALFTSFTFKMKDNCNITIEEALFTSLIVREQRQDSPLSIIKQIPFMWNGEVRQLSFIKNAVMEKINPVAFSKYQSLIPYAVTSVVFSYMLNITKAALLNNLNLNEDDKVQLLQKVEHFIEVVFPGSKNSSVNYICHLFYWFLNYNKISQDKAKILNTKIIDQVIRFGVSVPDFYDILEKHKIINDNTENPEFSYVAAMNSFVDEFLETYKKDFECVAKYMTLKL